MLVIDSQVHIWPAESTDRPWSAERRAYAHRASFGADELLREMAQADVDGVVLVPPSWDGCRNDVALAAARTHPREFRVMGRLDVRRGGVAATVASWREEGLLGFRVIFSGPDNRGALYDGSASAFWPLVQRAGAPVMVFAPGSLAEMGRVAGRHPDLRLVLDHLGLPIGCRGQDVNEHIDALVRLADFGNVAVKASGLPSNAVDGFPYRSVHGLIARVVDAFGVRRVFWGSDLTRLRCSYSRAVSMFTDHLDWLDSGELEWIMGRGVREWLAWS